ncbi:MAG: CAP domain-containing protein [Solirubrobacterales bacterium]
MTRTNKAGTRWTAAAVGSLVVVALLAWLALAARPGDAPAASAAKQARCALGDRPAAELTVRELRKSVICRINRQRERRDTRSLSRSKKLQKAAQKHTKVIVETECFAHQCPGEPELEQRIRRVGYLDGAREWGYAESTGCAESAAAMVRNWLDIRFHRMNLLGAKFRDVGIGAAQGGPEDRCKKGFATFTAVFGWRTR